MTESNWDNLEEELLKPVQEKEEKQRQASYRKLPSGSEAGVEWDGNSGELRTGPVRETPDTWDSLIEQWGMDPSEVEVFGPVRRSSWEAQTPDGIVTLNSFRAQLRKKVLSTTDIDQLIDEIKNHKPSKREKEEGSLAYVVCAGDLQLGKDSPEESIARFMKNTDDAVRRLKDLRSLGRSIGAIYLVWVGDCLEGVNGHYASQQFTITLNLTEQIRLARRLMLHQVKVFAPLASRVVLASVPGNHDEAHRIGGKNITSPSDSFATDIASQVSDILRENPKAYGHVSVVVPSGQSLTVSLDVCGTPVGLAHGHQFPRGNAMKWWADMAHGCQDVGDTTLLIAGHLHHLKILQEGKKTFLQIPSMDGGSVWYTNTTGKDSAPGAVSLVVGEGSWGDLVVM